MNVVVQTISTLGCSVDRAEDLAIGEKCELYLDWQGTSIGLQAEAVSRDAEGGVGLKFLPPEKDAQKLLSDLCAKVRKQAEPAPPAKAPGVAQPGADSAATRPPAAPAASPSPPTGTAKPAQVRERRRVPRYVSELRAHVSDPSTGASSRVSLITVSVLGGCAEGPSLPAVGQKCELKTEWEGKPLVLRGEVVWKDRERAGIEFAPLEASTDKLLRQVCANLRLQPLAPIPPKPSP